MKTTNLILVGLTLIGSAFISIPKAEANHCSRWDFTCSREHRGDCNLSGGNCSGGGSNGGGSQIQVITPPTYYNFQIRNGTQTPVYFSVNGTQHTLQPGYRQDFRLTRTSGSNSGGSSGQRYYVTINWDGFYANGYQARSYTLPYSPDEWYEFKANGGEIYLY